MKKKMNVKVKRVQKHIETLDMLKIAKANEDNKVDCGKKQQQPLRHSDPVVVTTKWETFD